MSFLNQFWRKPVNTTMVNEKAWKRALATAWDEKWQALSVEARRTYLRTLKPPPRSTTSMHQGTSIDKLEAPIVEELVAAGFARIEPGSGKRASKVVAEVATFDFSARLRALDRYRLLGASDRSLLINYVKYVYSNQGELVIAGVLLAVEIPEFLRLDEALELYVTTSQWPDWTLKTIDAKAATEVVGQLRKATGPVKLADLPGLVPKFKPKEVETALTELLTHLAVFEDLNPETLEIIVGLLPIVREHQAKSIPFDQPSPLVVCEKPKEVGPIGGLLINDLRVFLLEVAGTPPRLKQDGTLFAKEEPRFIQAMPPLPDWLVKLLRMTPERRLSQAFRFARTQGFTGVETEDNASRLELTGRGRKWLSTSLEDQYVKFYESFRDGNNRLDYDDFYDEFDDEFDDDFDDEFYHDRVGSSYDYYGDSEFYGISVTVHRVAGSQHRNISYYTPMEKKVRDELRASVFQSLDSLPVGVFHRWDSIVKHLCTGRRNPLLLGGEISKLSLFVNQRSVARLPDSIAQAGHLFLESFLLQRLLPFDAFRPALDDSGHLCVARLPRLAGYFGKAYEVGEDSASASTKVIVQPDFSVLVIGLDPAPAVELAPFCDRSGGHAGQGALTFKITRESVVRGSIQGLNATAILARLKKYASIEIPANVTNEIQEWAGWVRQVNVRPVMVIRCPDSATVARVLSVLGKKAERLSETMVALHTPNIGSAERQKLQDQGILITKQDISVVATPSTPEVSTTPASKKRGRPKKTR